MTHKDYQKFAAGFKALTNVVDPSPTLLEAGYQLAWSDCVRVAADIFAADNPRFKRDKFIKACGGDNVDPT